MTYPIDYTELLTKIEENTRKNTELCEKIEQNSADLVEVAQGTRFATYFILLLHFLFFVLVTTVLGYTFFIGG